MSHLSGSRRPPGTNFQDKARVQVPLEILAFIRPPVTYTHVVIGQSRWRGSRPTSLEQGNRPGPLFCSARHREGGSEEGRRILSTLQVLLGLWTGHLCEPVSSSGEWERGRGSSMAAHTHPCRPGTSHPRGHVRTLAQPSSGSARRVLTLTVIFKCFLISGTLLYAPGSRILIRRSPRRRLQSRAYI